MPNRRVCAQQTERYEVGEQETALQVEQYLEKSASRYPEKTALICGPERFTYAEIDRHSNRFANALVAHGVRRGDRVVVCLDNCSEAVFAIFAILKAGAVFVMVDHTTKSERLQYILNDCQANTLVLPADKLEDFQELLQLAPHLRTVFLTNRKDSAARRSQAMSRLPFRGARYGGFQRCATGKAVHRRGLGGPDLYLRDDRAIPRA